MKKLLIILFALLSFSCSAQFYGLNMNMDNAWNIAEGDSIRSHDFSAEISNAGGLFISPNSQYLYMLNISSDLVYQYTMSTYGDLSTISLTRSFDISAGVGSQRNLYFKSDGTKMFIVGTIGDLVDEWALSTAWNISTATKTTSYSVNTYQSSPTGLPFNSDGTKFYIAGVSDVIVDEFNVSVGWDLTSTITHVQSKDLSSRHAAIFATIISSEGNYQYIGTSTDTLYQYTMSTPYDISTLSYLQGAKMPSVQIEGIFFNSTGTKYYVLSSEIIYEYHIE